MRMAKRKCKGCREMFWPNNPRQLYHNTGCLHRKANRRFRRKAKRALRMMKEKIKERG